MGGGQLVTTTIMEKKPTPHNPSFAQFFTPSSLLGISEDALKETIFLSQLSDLLYFLFIYNP